MPDSETAVPVCQSCAMPLSTPEDCGTQADGSPTLEYCRHCFQAGSFTAELTQEQMIEKLVGFAAHQGMTAEQARRIAEQTLPRLKRWQSV
jgi:hypothetical protein